MWNFKSYLSKQPEMKMTEIRFLKYDKYAEISLKKKNVRRVSEFP